MAVIVAVAAGTSEPGPGSLALSDVAEGVSTAEVRGTSMFLVRDGDEVRAFSPDARHMAGEVVWWCPSAQVFVEYNHGSVFDGDGRKIAGPSIGALNTFDVVVADGRVVVDVERVTVGELNPRGSWPTGVDLHGAPLTFCEDKVVPLP